MSCTEKVSYELKLKLSLKFAKGEFNTQCRDTKILSYYYKF